MDPFQEFESKFKPSGDGYRSTAGDLENFEKKFKIKKDRRKRDFVGGLEKLNESQLRSLGLNDDDIAKIGPAQPQAEQAAATASEQPKKKPSFWERLGGYAKEFAEGVGGVLAGAAQAVPRSIKTLGLELRGEKEYRPQGDLEKLIYGSEPVKNFEGAGRDLAGIVGKDKDIDSGAATGLGAASTLLEVLPTGVIGAGVKRGLRQAAKQPPKQAPKSVPETVGLEVLETKGNPTQVAGLDVEAPTTELVVPLERLAKPRGPKATAAGKKERGFIETLRTSERTTPELATELEKVADYTPQPNDPLIKEAFKLVEVDINKAEQVAKESSNKGVAAATALIDHYQKLGNFERAGEIAEEAAERLTEAGRQVQAASIWNRLGPEGIVQYASRQLKKSDKKLTPELRDNLQKMAIDLKKIEDPEERALATKRMMDEIGRAKGSTLGEKVASLWKSGLLTSPLTTAGNIAGNLQETVVRKGLVDPIAAFSDQVMSLATGKRAKTFTMDDLIKGSNEGVMRGVKYLKTGYDPRRNPANKFDAKDVYFSDTKVGRAAEKYTQGVMRLMGAADQPFYYGALRNSLADQARAAAKTQGLKGAEKTEFIKNYVTEPTVDALKLADEEAQFATFQNKTKLGNAAARAKRAFGPGAEAVMPFTQVPSSIATRIITRTPIGTAQQIVKQIQNVRKGGEFDQRAMAQAIGEGGAGVALVGAGAALLKSGDINLGFPSDHKEAELWKQEGRQPYSVKIGDQWHSLNYLQPFGAILAMGAAFERAKKAGASTQDALAQSAAEAGKTLVEQSFLKGLSGTLKAINEPERYAESFIENLSNSVIPNVVDAVGRAMDENQRVVEGPVDAFKSTLPGLRETLPVKTDATGEPMKNEAGLSALINPLRSSPAKSTPMTEELRSLQDLKLGVMPTKATKKTFKVRDLTGSEERELTTSSAKKTTDIWNSLIKKPEYRSLTPEQKRKALDAARDDVWAVEKYRFGKEHGLNDDKSWENLSRAQRKLYQSGSYQDYIKNAKD